MKVVNPYFLHVLLEPLTGLADDESAVLKYRRVDTSSESVVRGIIRQVIVPHERTLNEKCRECVRDAYRYYLSKPGANLGRVYDSLLLPFDPPEDPRQFFLWVWEECYEGEPYLLSSIHGIVERADIGEPLSVRCQS